MSNQNQQKLKAELARRELARRRLLFFTQQFQPNYLAGWVHRDICTRLERFSQAVIARKSPRLMLLMPPRHGKSTLASIMFPAWHLGRCPQHEWVNASYNLELPMKFSRQVREVFRSPAYNAMFPAAKIAQDSQSVESWMTTVGGSYSAVGVGGGLTGRGATIAAVDDPIKNMEEADSIDIRDKLWDWFQSVLLTRLAPGGGVLVVQTCWSDDDLAGRLQQLMESGDAYADQYEVISYPALSESYEYRDRTTFEILRSPSPLVEANDVEFLRAPDEALHPERYDRDALVRKRANMSPRIWSALYQQNPVPDEGLYFTREMIRLTKSRIEVGRCNIVTSWDLAFGEKQHNDWTVGITGFQDTSDVVHIQDVQRFKANSHAVVEAMLDVAEKYMPLTGGRYRIVVEDGGHLWRGVKPFFDKRCAERKLYPSVEVARPLTDKQARARPLQGRMQQGRVVILDDQPWTQTLVNEFLRFPAGVHDDCVDAAAWLIHSIANQAAPLELRKPGFKSWKDRLNGLVSGGATTHMAA